VRVALIADTHMPRGARRLPAECVRIIAGADLVIHAGDFMGEEAYEEIAAIGPPLVGVHGNVDAKSLQKRLPERIEVDLGGAVLGVIHDSGPSKGRLARMRRAFPQAAAVLFGHSHIPLHERDADGFQIFNPGSPTERRRSPKHTMGVVVSRAGALEFELIELD
jgi:putative phosphoesterase